MGATTAVFDFSLIDSVEAVEYEGEERLIAIEGSAAPLRVGGKGGIIGRPVTSNNAKQVRARARRRNIQQRGGLTDADLHALYHKPLDEWDMEELARGRSRDKNGNFSGAKPKFLQRDVHEQAIKRFEMLVRGEMQLHTIDSLVVIKNIMSDQQVDAKGKPTTPASVKLDAAKFLIEHLIGKPKQRQEVDISVTLQSILGAAMVNPSLGGDGTYALAQGSIEVPSWEEDLDERDDDTNG